jgi:hypothetical protein
VNDGLAISDSALQDSQISSTVCDRQTRPMMSALARQRTYPTANLLNHRLDYQNRPTKTPHLIVQWHIRKDAIAIIPGKLQKLRSRPDLRTGYSTSR